MENKVKIGKARVVLISANFPFIRIPELTDEVPLKGYFTFIVHMASFEIRIIWEPNAKILSKPTRLRGEYFWVTVAGGNLLENGE